MDPLTWTLTSTGGLAAWPGLRTSTAPRTCPSVDGLCLTLATLLSLRLTCSLVFLTWPRTCPIMVRLVTELFVDPGSHPQSCPAPLLGAEGQTLDGKVVVLPAQGSPLLPIPWSWGSSQPAQHPDSILPPPPGCDPRSYTARGFPVLISQALYSVMMPPEEGDTFSYSNERNFLCSISSCKDIITGLTSVPCFLTSLRLHPFIFFYPQAGIAYVGHFSVALGCIKSVTSLTYSNTWWDLIKTGMDIRQRQGQGETFSIQLKFNQIPANFGI